MTATGFLAAQVEAADLAKRAQPNVLFLFAGEMTIRDEELMPWPRTPEGVKAYLAEYYRYITYLDEQIGRILDALAASPYVTNTIVVFSADSGVACGSRELIGIQNWTQIVSSMKGLSPVVT